MNTTLNPTEPNWLPFTPKTEAEKEEELLDELKKEFAKEDALPPQDKYSVEKIRDILGSAMMAEILLKEDEDSTRGSSAPTSRRAGQTH